MLVFSIVVLIKKLAVLIFFDENIKLYRISPYLLCAARKYRLYFTVIFNSYVHSYEKTKQVYSVSRNSVCMTGPVTTFPLRYQDHLQLN